MNQILMIVMAVGAVLGGVDRLRGNKWGFGDKFETGFMLMGSMALSMAGMICLTPVLAQWLEMVIVPFYQLIGVDPAMFGSLLAVSPVLGVVGGLAIGGLSVGAGMMYRVNRRQENPLEPGKRRYAIGFHRKKLTEAQEVPSSEENKPE